MLDPISRCLNVESARALIDLRADPAVQSRVTELAEKCNEGSLSLAEREEYETYVSAGNFIAILKAKAKLHLKQRGVG